MGALLGIQPGDDIADLGAGHGWFSFPFARMVGSEGSVVALEIEPAVISLLEHQVRVTGQDNLRPVLSRPDSLMSEPGSLEWIFAAEVLGLVEGADARRARRGEPPLAPALFQDMRRSLAPGGTLVVSGVSPAFENLPRYASGAGRELGLWRKMLDAEGFQQLGSLEPFNGDFEVQIFRLSGEPPRDEDSLRSGG